MTLQSMTAETETEESNGFPEAGTFFLPGPTEVRAEVLRAMSAPMISHRGPEFETMFARIQSGLRVVFGTRRPVFIGTCSATGFMEAGLRCAPAGRTLALVNGSFSERFARIATACGREVDEYTVGDGEVHDPEEVARRLGTGEYSVVTVVHSETSTGALNDVRAISEAASRTGTMCLVDSVTAAAGTEIRFDDWQMDYVLTGSQKALALPPGLAFAVASERFMQSARGGRTGERGIYFDLVEFEEYAPRNQVPNTPAIPLIYALDTQLAAILAEGMDARCARHAAMARRTQQWATELGATGRIDIRVLAREGHRSPTVTTVMLPATLTSGTVVRAVAERGFTIGTGYGRLRQSSIRIGHMGDHTMGALERCLAACSEALVELTGRLS